jgi:hypothetical protein
MGTKGSGGTATAAPRTRTHPDLSGNLTAFHPVAVLQMLNLAEATGELRLCAPDNVAQVFFARGHVTWAGIRNRTKRLGEVLVAKGVVSADDLARALAEKTKSQRLGDRLIEDKLVERAVLVDAIETQIREVIYEALRWREGSFSFRRGRRPQNEDVFLDVPLDHLMLEGLTRWDEDSAGGT